MLSIIFVVIFYYCAKSSAIVLVCDLKHSDVGYGHYDTCEVGKPPLDTSYDKIIQNAIGWSKSRTTNDVVQFYTEYVNCIYFPFDLNTVFPELEIIRLWKSKVKYIENMDLKNLIKLKILDLEDNDIEVLQSDLFMYNVKLKEIHLQNNKLKFIAARLFSQLNLIVLKLEGNLCVHGNAVNDISAMLTLKNKVDETCSAPEFLLEKNSKLIKSLVNLNFSFVETSKRKELLEIDLSNVNNSLSICEEEKENLENERFRMKSQIKKDASSIKKLNDELYNVKELNNDMVSENVRLKNEIKKLSQKSLDAEERVYDLITNNRTYSAFAQIDSFKERILKYENEKLLKENFELKVFKEQVERDWRTIKMHCLFTFWNSIYSCQSDKIKVNIDDSEVAIEGKHLTRKSNYDVKNLLIISINVKTLFLPINLGSVFPQLQSIMIQNSNLISIKIENFDNMPDLKLLNLDNNLIEEVPYDAFTYPQKMEKLSISFNRIKILNKDTFKHLKELKYLFLNDNKIQKIHADLFKYNTKIEILALQNNNIKHIGMNTFESLKELKLVNLENNECMTGKFNYESIKLVSGSISIECSLPEAHEVYCKFLQIESDYTCDLVDIRIENDNALITSIDGDHLDNKENVNVHHLKATNQNMQYFPAGFSNFYKNLEKISVKNSELLAISENDFKGLLKIKELILLSNKIKFLDAKCFNDLSRLELLNLSNNQITQLPENIFNKLVNLKYLDVSLNKIQKLSPNLFHANHLLEVINASGNKISHIGAALLNNKRNLQAVNFIANSCISEKSPDISLNDLKLKILELCQQ